MHKCTHELIRTVRMRFFHNYFFFFDDFLSGFLPPRGEPRPICIRRNSTKKKKQPDRCRGRLGCFFPGFFFGARFNLAMLIRIS